jgi:hypothetical protein
MSENPIITAYLAENGKYISNESSAANIESLTDAEWPAILEALDELHGGCTDPGIDCDVVITHDTLADFDVARRNDWREPGSRTDLVCAGRPATHYGRLQVRKGQPRTDLIVVDLGDRRVALT